MTIKLSDVHTISAGDTEVVSVNFANWLDSGELLTGTPTVAEVSTSDLTLADKSVNSSSYVDAHTGETVFAGQAAQFSVSGGTAGTEYQIKVTVTTDATVARTKEVIIELRVE
jgi:hypothetical protein